ncbi:hypothetical protein [Spirulina subsalsa]|uniref:hypothetical protein n=1 Tax=Spirulina subsalsa TaxID=54311 RepID=UPI0002E028D3|nr:hypothetical protein [Spirulina subsalsa]
MHLNQLVKINQEGIVASSVNFGHLQDSEANLRLCKGFIFNYNSHKPENSTIGILDRLCGTYQSRTLPNIHLIVQDYGKGKSHFAVTVANFFQKGFDTPEVQGIVTQVAVAAGTSNPVAQRIKNYKQNQKYRHLVICLSGDHPGDLREQFLASLLQVLEQEGVTETIAQQLCSEPLRYLNSLSPEERKTGDDYLAEIDCPEGDIKQLIQLLEEHCLQAEVLNRYL